MRRFRILLLASLTTALLVAPSAADAQSGGWGRFSLLMQSARSQQESGLVSNFSEVAASLTLRSPSGGEGGFEYAIDMRSAAYPGTERDNIFSVYDAYVGYQNTGGGLGVRVGHVAQRSRGTRVAGRHAS